MFGGRRRALEAADAQAQAEEEEGRALRVSLLAELASSYVALRSAQERQRIALDTVASLETARRLAQTRYERGLGSAVEAAQARAELELGQARLPALREEQARLAHAIGVLTGGFPGELKDALAQGPARMPEPPPLPSGLPSEMLRNRPDIRASGAGWPPPRRGSAWPSRNAFRASSFRWTWAARPVWSVICSRAPAWPGRSAPAPVSRCTTAGGPRRDSARRRPAPRRSAWPMNTACGGPSRTWRTRWPAECRARAPGPSVGRRARQPGRQDRATRLYRSGLIGYLPVLAAQQATYRARDELALNALARSRHAIGLYKALGAGWEAQAAPASGADGG